MDSRLFKATTDCTSRRRSSYFGKFCAQARTIEIPLHLAALAGKADFIDEIIRRKPSVAWDPNREDGFSHLHIVSAVGHKEEVQELLVFGSQLCMLKDKQGLIPLHHAAMKGRVSIIEELLQCCPDSINERTARGQTALHLAVDNCQFGTFKTLVEKLHDDDIEDFVNTNDNDGNTIFQMATSSKQLRVPNKLIKSFFF